MDLATWFVTLIEKLLQNTAAPGWIVQLVIDFVKRYITADFVKHLEEQLKCYICSWLKELETTQAATPIGPAAKDFAALINCANCP